ncbi:MAG TPA: Crp/Fnr family transcriptional regulator [Bacteroidetes bacterium]|nr:Crp/Fnr family transcriptional regulator [Bacteroidota bacterium]
MKPSTVMEYLRHFPLFHNMPEECFSRLEKVVQVQKAARYARLYEMGDPSDKVFFLLKGTVKTCTISNEGREVIKTVLHPVAMFGELGLVGEKHRHESAVSLNKDVEYCTISVKEFQALMQANYSLCLKILHLVGKRLLTVEQKLESLIFKDARARIIDFLKQNAIERGRRVGYEMFFKHCLTQQDIANLTGTSRQTVTAVLNDLRKENLIYFTRNSVLIRDVGKLG